MLARALPTSQISVTAVRPRQRTRLAVEANTLWQLTPDAKWCNQPENARFCRALGQVDLTGPIGSKKICSVASSDYETDEAQDLCITQHGSLHLVFDAEGTSNPLDSPSRLFITDVDSKCEVAVNGQPLQKGQRTQIKPGSLISMGQEAQYQVQRNVFAHA